MVGASHEQRRLSGGASVKLLVWIVVFFGAYGAYKVMGVHSVEKTIERAVVEICGKVDHNTTHKWIKHNIVRTVNVASISLDPENIRVKTERRPGERLVEVEVAHPVTVSLLGSERVFTASVKASQVVPINEALVAREAEHKRQAEAYIEEVREALDDCREKYGRGNCNLTETPSTEFGVVRNF